MPGVFKDASGLVYGFAFQAGKASGPDLAGKASGPDLAGKADISLVVGTTC